MIIHAAAYTNVDGAESFPARAQEVNTAGAASVAMVARETGAKMIYLSTDFVFDGNQGMPYRPQDLPNPVNEYGKSKLAGEQEVQRISDGQALILRTAWVYSRAGENFVKTMLRLMREQESLTVVCDQVGTPTWARSLALALWRAVDQPSLRGILHWTDAGVSSWYDFAVAIQDEAFALGLLTRQIPIRPVRTEQFPRPARRPPFSVLDKTTGWAALGGPAPHWRANLRRMLEELADG